MPGKRRFDEQITALDALRQQPDEARVEPLRKALGNRSNFIVARAADLVREFSLATMIPELLAGFNRFFDNPEKTDPQCWAKIAIARALASFEHQDAEVFLRGMRHIQLEAVWGGRSDTAGPLRAICALALVQVRSLRNDDLLLHLVDLLADKDKTVRAELARAIEQVGSASSSLLLRLKALSGDNEPEVLGACYGGILRIEGVEAIPWVSRFLDAGDDSAAEAALAIAETHSAEGFETLRKALDKTADPWFRSVLLSAIALTRQDAATEFLLDLVRQESPDAERAIEAVLRSAPTPETIKRVEDLVADNPRLKRALVTHGKSTQQ